MQPTICSRCQKNMAVIFITRIEGNETKNEGLCLSCAKDLGIKPVEDMIEKMGLNEDDLEGLTSEMMSALTGNDGSDPLTPHEPGEDDEDEGRTATFPFLNKLFGGATPSEPAPTDPTPTPASGDAPPRTPKDDKEKPAKGDKGSKRKFLDAYCVSLTQKAMDGNIDKIIGRDSELQRLVQILNRRQKNNPCLIGEPGVGKTAIAEGLALRIADGSVPYKLLDKEVYLLDLTALVAGTQFRGQFESRMKGLIDEVKRLGNILLVIDEVHNLVGAGDAEGSMSAANILKPALSRGEIQVIGATTLTEYRKYIEKDSALERRFQPIMVDEPTMEDAINILKGIAPYYEKYHSVSISPDMCRLAVTMSERYITDRFLPDKAIDLIDEASSDVNLNNKALRRALEIDKELADIAKEEEVMLAAANNKSSSEEVQALRRSESSLTQKVDAMKTTISTDPSANNHVKLEALQKQLADATAQRSQLENEASDKAYARLAVLKSQSLQLTEERKALEPQLTPPLTVANFARVIELWTKIPATRIQEEEYERLAQLETRLKSHIIGQDDAIKSVAGAIRRGRVGIASKRKPMSFIFVGSTGVGKTELVKQLSMDMFNSLDSLIRLDMSEFMEKFAVSRIIGSPPGYVGYDEAGQLTEKVRRKPYCVVLFDEIEKAHPDVLNILLQILDDGHITDAQGRKVNFENAVIVMTSNAGSSIKSNSLGFDRSANEQGRERALKALGEFLRPEFINRVDEVIYFNQLSEDNFKHIAEIMLSELTTNLLEKNITFTWDISILDYLVEKAYSATYGARNLRRQIQRDLEDPIASKIIETYLTPVKNIHMTLENGELKLHSL